MFGYSWGPILIILLIVLILFGPKRLPELAEGIGKAIKSFKKAHDEPENLPKQEAGSSGAGGPGANQPATCPACQKELVGDFAFCPNCGHKLKA
ncbi:MAG: twin-arginine translocase TatA/TatE family subunit [Deltaproteobacteria bacterium]|nr:twin-arginine translocase TatA/TatE family subunit [Deltaproteobacteria bacterium]